MTYTPSLEQALGHAAGEGGVAEHHRDDRVLAGLEVEAGLRQAGAEDARVLEQPRAQLAGCARGGRAPRGSPPATTGGMLLENR